MDKIVLHWVRVPLHEPFRISSGSVTAKDAVIVEAHEGRFIGFGEASPMAGTFYSPETPESTWEALVTRLIPWTLATLPPSRNIEAADPVPEDEPFARAGLEGALWDLVCQQFDRPLWQRLGSEPRPIPSGAAIGLFDTLEELLARTGQYLAAGYRRVKIKIRPGWDIEPVRAIRERWPEVPLMVDANAAYSIRDLPLFEELDRFGLVMFEQPFGRGELEAMGELQRRVRTPVCADESAESLAALERIIELGSARIINVKIQRVGGIERARRMHDRARAAGLDCWLGTMPELGVAAGQGLHLATLPGFIYPTDVESSERWFVDDVVDPPLAIDGQGLLHLPPGAGSGFRVNPAKLDRYLVRRAEFRA